MLEHELETVLLCVGIPMRPVPSTLVFVLVLDLSGRDAERYGLIRLGGDLHNIAIHQHSPGNGRMKE